MTRIISTLLVCIAIFAPNYGFSKKKINQVELQLKTIAQGMKKIEAKTKMRSKGVLELPRLAHYNLYDFDLDSIPDKFDKCPSTPGTPERFGCPDFDHTKLITFIQFDVPITEEEFNAAVFAFKRLEFDKKGKITRTSMLFLNEFIDVFKRRTNLLVSLSSYVDVGEDANNEELSKNRLKELRSYMISQGIAPKRIKGFYFGDTMPVVDLPPTRFEVEISY